MKNNDNNMLNNVEESNYNNTTNKETSASNFVRDLSPDSITKPWYKKKSSIIGISSTLGVGVLTTAITVPLVLTSTQNTAELSKVITVYDLNKKTAKLIVEGKNLPNDKTLYSVSKETTTKASDPIVAEKITLNFISASEISLDFADPTINAKTVYQVKLNNGTSSGNTIISNPTDNVKLPTFTITSEPSNVTLSTTAPSQSATFSVTASAVTNPISNQSLSYQWKISDTNTTTDESKWSIIPNETKPTLTYDAKTLAINTKKYFKCIVSYKYANSVTSNSVFVERVNAPTINVSVEPRDVDIEYSSTDSTATLSVTANVINGNSNQSLSYQWQISDSQTGTFTPIQSATSRTYEVTNIAAGSKKYYKCIISYTGATSIESAIVHVAKASQPVITITGQPANQQLSYNATTASTLSVVASVEHGDVSGLTYQWQSSSQSSTGFTDIVNATSSTYSLTSDEIAAITPTVSKYYKCIVTYTGAVQKESGVATISKAAQPVISVITNPAATSLTSESTTFTLQSAATVANQISGQQVSYQWQSSSTQTGTYTDIEGATQQNFTKTLDANKNAWRDTWYKCKITYPSATPAFTGNALVKMTLTQAEAKVELLKWLAIESNAISVLTRYFNEPIGTSVKNTFYRSLHDHEFPEGNPTLVVHSIEPMPITANASYPTSYKSYKIKLKTTSAANITTKRTGGASTRTTYATGMIIEFNTLFSFGGEKVEFFKADDAKYNMILQPTFTTYNNKPTTTLLWGTDTANGITAPTTTNPYKKGAYPVKFYENETTTTPAIDDSVFLPSRLQAVYTGGEKDYLYPMIPTYHIV